MVQIDAPVPGLTAEPQQECLVKLPVRYVTANSDVLHPCKFQRYSGVNSVKMARHEVAGSPILRQI
jgi:hypothetical protein